MKHTELPWTYAVSMNDQGECFDLCDVDVSGYGYIGEIDDKDNAEFIVKAVNNHDKLIGALKGIMAEIGGGKKICGHDFDCVCASDAAKKALKEAE